MNTLKTMENTLSQKRLDALAITFQNLVSLKLFTEEQVEAIVRCYNLTCFNNSCNFDADEMMDKIFPDKH